MSLAAPRVLITGASGCAGWHLSALAQSNGADVAGLDTHTPCLAGVALHVGDIRSQEFVSGVIASVKPDWVFHLAARIPGPSAATAEDFISTNITGTFHLLEAVRKLAPQARVLVASSSAVYGRPQDAGRLIDEESPLRPQSVYAVSKAAQDLLALQYATSHGLHILSARTFNQTGPREPDGLVCATIAQQIARIEAGVQEPIVRTVTLTPRRDFTDVRDVVAGYWAAIEHGSGGQAYNICSGRSVAIQRVADVLIGLSRVTGIQLVEVGPPPRPDAILNQIGDASRLKQCSAWQPQIPFEASLADLLDDCRARLGARASV